MKHNKLITKLAIGALAIGTAVSANAQTLNFVAGSPPTSIDPQFHQSTPNLLANSTLFESLIAYNDSYDGGIMGRLATSWKQLPGNKIEMNLRKGVKFHDGTDFTAADVVYTMCRITRVKESISSYGYKIADWKDIEVVNDHKIIIHKKSVAPSLIINLVEVSIISDSIAGSPKIDYNEGKCDGFKNVKTSDFNNGKHAIGTAPYKFKSFVKNQSVSYVKNDNYWGSAADGNDPAAFDEIKITSIKNKGARLAALLAGDVDAIEGPSTNDLERLRKDPNFDVVVSKPLRSILFRMSQLKDDPTIKTHDGKNPFRDVRVRKAMSLAINRKLLVDRIMGEVGIPAHNIGVDGFLGIERGKNYYEYNPEKAKKLLAEAGYPDGFEIVFGAPNDRYLNDAKMAQGIAQMLSRIGIKVKLETATKSVFFSNVDKRRVYSTAITGWAAADRTAYPLLAGFASADKSKERGGENPGDFDDPEMDRILDESNATADPKKRHEILKRGVERAMDNMTFFTTHFERFPMAVSNKLEYTIPYGHERTDLRYLKPKK